VPFAINCLLAYLVSVWSTGQFLPTGNIESVWFISAISLWSISLISSPWFSPPKDILVNAIAATLVLITLDLSQASLFKVELETAVIISVAYCVGVGIMALVALIKFEEKSMSWGVFLYKTSAVLGRADILFTAPVLIAVIAAFQNNQIVLLWLLLLWMIVVIAQPVEHISLAYKRLTIGRALERNLPIAGTIERVDHPNVVRVKIKEGSNWVPNSLYIASLPGGIESYVLSLFSQTQDGEIVGTGLCLGQIGTPLNIPSGSVRLSPEQSRLLELLKSLSGRTGAEIVGFVVENSSIGQIRYELASIDSQEEGELILVRIRGQDVYYQVTDAETHEESFDSNPRGTQIVHATQLGCYDANQGFSRYNWLPEMNTPVFSAKAIPFAAVEPEKGCVCIGKIPRTSIEVLANIDELVAYHSAILGATGTGKTELTLALVDECLKEDVKVFCVDFTGEYRERLSKWKPVFPAMDGEQSADLIKLMSDVEYGEYGAKKEKKNLDKAIVDATETVGKDVESFLKDDKNRLAILELSEITNSKLTLRLTELYLSLIMKWAIKNRKQKKVLIVLEEAHTIIPEPIGSGFDADTKWVVERIGQIALQGRKYGVGLMVVSQRTALVSKTILSQCNTFFTHALIDKTSLDFLGNVYSYRHVGLIPDLAKFQFLAFGRAIRCERPVVVQREFDAAVEAASKALDKKINGGPINQDKPRAETEAEPRGPRISFP
jgi:hypothetical protein